MKDLIEGILKNFKQQYQLYEDMEKMSERQLEWLQNKLFFNQSDEITVLLQKRQAMIETIDFLNAQNKILQERINKEYQLDEFALSQLKQHLDEATYIEFQSVIRGLGKLLAKISTMDEKSHQLLKDGVKARVNMSPHRATNDQANRAYKQAMTKGETSL